MAEKYGLSVADGGAGQGLAGRGRVTYGGNSGHQAVHLAYNLGASRILLLGYDFGGDAHWFGEHPQPLKSGHDFDLWLREMALLGLGLQRAGVEVINCSRKSAITCFPRMSIDDVEDYSDRTIS